ncbi:nucleotidyl transferase AbiEii/AbiGii toxin family protein [Streptomyces sp. 184]|uniref:nucleotidyl transferase AbiEii/AbiGii toxin family protein n=1 Tax=Streptomyces sp. 184 TaxID=1827526 RepID=UPI003892A437
MTHPFRAWRPADEPRLPTPDRHTLRGTGILLDAVNSVLADADWHLKGSAALLAWAGPGARMPEDVDLAVAAGRVGAVLPGGSLSRHAAVRVVRAERIMFRSGDRAPVHRALARVSGAGLSVEILLNVAEVPDEAAYADARRSPLVFPGGPAPAVPAATFGRCLAQKLLRYTLRRTGGRIATRWSDLLDFLLCVSSTRSPGLALAALRRDVAAELTVVGRDWPPLPVPPAEWLDFWDTAVFRRGLDVGRLPEAVERAHAFWGPVLAENPPDGRWDPGRWAWV